MMFTGLRAARPRLAYGPNRRYGRTCSTAKRENVLDKGKQKKRKGPQESLHVRLRCGKVDA